MPRGRCARIGETYRAVRHPLGLWVYRTAQYRGMTYAEGRVHVAFALHRHHGPRLMTHNHCATRIQIALKSGFHEEDSAVIEFFRDRLETLWELAELAALTSARPETGRRSPSNHPSHLDQRSCLHDWAVVVQMSFSGRLAGS